MSARVAALEPVHLDALAALFRACECPCFCRYWHFEGDKNAWLARCAESPQVNEAELRSDVVRGEPRSWGVIGLEGDEVVGWLKLAPRVVLTKLRTRPVYKSLDLGDGDGVLSIGCMLVHPKHRRAGVATDLVHGAIVLARARGAVAIEAYPHVLGGDAEQGDHLVWMGPHTLFVACGFRRVAGEDAYPVLRFTI